MIEVAEWIADDFDGETTEEEILDTAARRLEKAGAFEAIGTNLFRGKDGKLYTVVVTAAIEEAAEGFANDIMDSVGYEAPDA